MKPSLKGQDMEQNGVRQSASARQEDPWRQVSPQQCLRLIVGLGVRQEEVAQSLQVPRSTLAVWLRGAVTSRSPSILCCAGWRKPPMPSAGDPRRPPRPPPGSRAPAGDLARPGPAGRGARRMGPTPRSLACRQNHEGRAGPGAGPARLSAIGAHANQDHWSHAETATILTLCKQVLYALRTWEEPEENALQ